MARVACGVGSRIVAGDDEKAATTPERREVCGKDISMGLFSDSSSCSAVLAAPRPLLPNEKQQRRATRSYPVRGLAFKTSGQDLGTSAAACAGPLGGRKAACGLGDVQSYLI
jgi:hypothetical protein